MGRISGVKRFTPGLLLPEFTWPQRVFKDLATNIAEPPKPSHRFVSRFWAWVHHKLLLFSVYYYCNWVGIPIDIQIAPLPFGLLLKRSDGTRFEEVQAMRLARAAGFPVPKVICYGENPKDQRAPVSILMTRLPGDILGDLYECMTEKEKFQVLSEMKNYLDIMRSWSNPWGTNRICSVSNSSIRSVRAPGHLFGPYDDQKDFQKYLIGPSGAAKDLAKYETDLVLAKKLHDDYDMNMALARKLQDKTYRVVFTHGDLMHHNILVKDGHVTGFIDWEAAGWYPEYWEFTTAWMYQPRDSWWWQFVHDLGGGKYMEEMENDRALMDVTSDAWAG